MWCIFKNCVHIFEKLTYLLFKYCYDLSFIPKRKEENVTCDVQNYIYLIYENKILFIERGKF